MRPIFTCLLVFLFFFINTVSVLSQGKTFYWIGSSGNQSINNSGNWNVVTNWMEDDGYGTLMTASSFPSNGDIVNVIDSSVGS